MFAAFKSEVRKILSLRSTYISLLLALALLGLFAFYVPGWETTPETLQDPGFQKNQVFSAVSTLSLLSAIIAILSVTHEYRYNTIMYTITANRSRTQVFLSKLLTLSLFAVLFAAFFGVLALLLTMLATDIRGLQLSHQALDVWTVGWRALFGGFAFVAYAFIFAMIIRVQVGAMSGFFLAFALVEPLASLVLKKYAAYLPFQSLNIMLETGASEAATISSNRAAIAVAIYVAVGLIVSWVLFLRRDATT